MMNKVEEALNSKTVLEYLVLINQQSYVQIGKQLGITSQQFSDWIKKRRPIPEERLKALSSYFGVEENYIVDEKRFTQNLNRLNKIDIEMILLHEKIEAGDDKAEYYKERINRLEQEKVKQIRIARLTSILEKENEQIDKIIDKVLELIETNDFEKLSQL